MSELRDLAWDLFLLQVIDVVRCVRSVFLGVPGGGVLSERVSVLSRWIDQVVFLGI